MVRCPSTVPAREKAEGSTSEEVGPPDLHVCPVGYVVLIHMLRR